MNFLLSANNNYLLPLSVCITSILENHKYEDINVYVFENDFTEESKQILRDLFDKYRQTLHIMHIDDHYYNDVPILRWSKETYYRLLVGELLPKNISTILYLDCDIIINKNIKSLFKNILDQDFYLLAAEIKEYIIPNLRVKMGLDASGKYFQAGVMLLNVERFRQILDYNKSIELINELGANITAVDQDIINKAFDGKISPIDEKYNNCEVTNFYGNNWHRLSNKTYEKKLHDISILHYSTGKPWNNLFSGSCEKLWYKYLKLSPFSSLYEKKFNKLKYKITRTGISKFLFYEYIHITPFIDNLFKKILSVDQYKKIKNYYRKYIK